MTEELKPLRISIYLPGSYNDTDQSTKYSQVLKNCPACASSLVLLLEKLGKKRSETSEEGKPNPHGPLVSDKSDPWTKENADTRGDGNGGWYCSQCGVHIVPAEAQVSSAMERILSSMREDQAAMKSKENDTTALHNSSHHSSVLSPARKVLDDEYQSWEIQLQSEFTDFLGGIRDHFSDKEKQLRKYQVDLCHREKQLITSEENFRERLDKFNTNEHELRDRIERLNEYKKTMLKQVSAQMKTLEFRCRTGNGYRKLTIQGQEVATQTDIAGIHFPFLRDRLTWNNRSNEIFYQAGNEQKHNNRDPPPPYSSSYDLRTTANQGDSRLAPRASSLSPDRARGASDVAGQETTRPPITSAWPLRGRREMAYSPSRSVSVDDVQIRRGASPPERDTTRSPVLTKPADLTREVHPIHPDTSRLHSPRRDERSLSPAGRDYTLMSPPRGRELSPHREQHDFHRAQQTRSPSPYKQGSIPAHGPVPTARRDDLSVNSGDRAPSPERDKPYGLTAQTLYPTQKVLVHFRRSDEYTAVDEGIDNSGGPGYMKSKQSPRPIYNPEIAHRNQGIGGFDSEQYVDNARQGRDSQGNIELDEHGIPPKPRLTSVRSWDIITNNSDDSHSRMFPSSANLVPPSSGNLVPLEEDGIDAEGLNKPIQDKRHFQFAPSNKSSGLPSPASDNSTQSNKRGGGSHIRKPIIAHTKLRLHDHGGSSASEADSRSSASNSLHRPPDNERGRPLSRNIKSGSNIGSYDAKQYSTHQRSTSAGVVLETDQSQNEVIDEGFYDVRNASSRQSDNIRTNTDLHSRDRQNTTRDTGPHSVIHQTGIPVKPDLRQQDCDYMDMNGTVVSKANNIDTKKPDQTNPSKNSKPPGPGKFSSKISLFLRRGDAKSEAKKSTSTKSNPRNHLSTNGKIKLDDKSTWAIKKRRDDSQKHKDSKLSTSEKTAKNESHSTETEKLLETRESTVKGQAYKRQPIPFSVGAGRRSLNSGIPQTRSQSPMKADHSIAAGSDNEPDSRPSHVRSHSSGAGTGQTGGIPTYKHLNGGRPSKPGNALSNGVANNRNFTSSASPKSHHQPRMPNLTFSTKTRQITPPRDYGSKPTRPASPKPRTQSSNYGEYAHKLSPRNAYIPQSGQNTYDSEV